MLGVKETISHQKARSMVSEYDWSALQRNCQVYSKDMKWIVTKEGYLYFQRPCNLSR